MFVIENREGNISCPGLVFEDNHSLMEREYSPLHEADAAKLLMTGNGYMCVRASLEEYAGSGIQWFGIKGVTDEVIEVKDIVCNNLYEKKYGIGEKRSKKFEKQEVVINLLDFLLVRFRIGGETFYPWEGKVLSWKRYLDLSDGVLHREVVWKNTEGQQTRFDFQRFASFADVHTYCIYVEMEPLNYSEKVIILSGMDLRTESNGQTPQRTLMIEHAGHHTVRQEGVAGPKYGVHSAAGICQRFGCALYGKGVAAMPSAREVKAIWEDVCEDGIAAQRIMFDARQGDIYALEKLIAVMTGRDTKRSLSDCMEEYMDAFDKGSYQEEYKKHLIAYQELLPKPDIPMKGDDRSDCGVRFSNYHSMISLERNHDEFHKR